jgi:transcriptional regulator GlxA family with amidase domain
MLQAQAAADAPFAALIDWMQDHLDRDLDVPTLARHAGYSERSFYRKFTEATGKTPAHFVEDLRLDAARTLLSKGLPLKLIAGRVGLTSSARLGQAFERRFGLAPSLFRQMHVQEAPKLPATATSIASSPAAAPARVP